MTDRYEKIRELIAERDQLAAEVEALRAELDESCAVVDKLARLLAETAIVIKGPEPDMTKWSYHDIPDGVRAIQARAERLAEALREAREYVVSELAAERDKFAGYEHCSNIASIEADLAKIDAALSNGGLREVTS